MTRAMTPQDAAYVGALNLFGSDPEPPEIDALFAHLREDAEASHLFPEQASAGEDT
jgi:hypothetical protein